MKNNIDACVELLKQGSFNGKLDSYMFSRTEIQRYLCLEINGSSFKMFRRVCLGYLKEVHGVILSEEEVGMLFKKLPSGFVSVGAYVLRKERNNY